MLDLDNLYFATRLKYGRKIEIFKYVEAVGHPSYRVAYSTQKEKDCPKFVSVLMKAGFTLKFGQPTCPILIALEVASLINEVDHFIIGSNNQQLIALLAWIRKNNKQVTCLACNIPEAFRIYASCNEIGEGLLDGSSAKS